jgi:Flp pilus assembly CpaF family ATPase
MNKHTAPSIWSFDGDDSVAGHNTLVCGTSGAGKTTLMQSIVGKYSADAVRHGIYLAPTPPSDDEDK